ncbi:MAG TPA: FAD-binding oxidoreductase [Turneriella sp.]|nr:FAD-binding oxidoreductase [Turneriella sp.]
MIYILGAGIAGLTLAEVLHARNMDFQVFEKQASLGKEASGKNAGMLRTYDTDTVLKPFTLKSLEYYRQNEPSFVERGMILKPWEIDYAETPEGEKFFSHNRFKGFFLPANGTLEPLEVLDRLHKKVKNIALNAPVGLKVAAQRIAALKIAEEEIPLKEDDKIVVAAGEGSVALAHETATPIELIAYRRTLYEFKNTIGHNGPIEWDEEASVYFRPSGGGKTLTATAGDQIPVAQGTVDEDLEDDKAFQIIEREFPFLNRENLVSKRICRRLMPLDNRPFIGRDTSLANLYWFTGLGGRGMSMSPGIAPYFADLLLNEKKILEFEPFLPGRVVV